jgi:ASC-1-like (ASCH) protein
MECNVGQPWFDMISKGTKTIEGRLKKGKFASVKVGSPLVVKDAQTGAHIKCHVSEIVSYASFRELLEQEGLKNVLPGVANVASGVAVYRAFYSSAQEAEHGVIGLRLSLSDMDSEELYSKAKELSSPGSRQQWNDDPELNHMKESTIKSGIVAKAAAKAGALSYTDVQTCKKLAILWNDRSLKRYFA